MTALPAPRHRPSGLLEPWTAPLDHAALQALLARLVRWQPFDEDALWQDVGEALDDVAPLAGSLHGLARRLREHLAQLAGIGAGAKADRFDGPARVLIMRARELGSVPVPGGYWSAVGHLRQMAWTVSELAERLAVLGCLKKVAV